jgi:Uma2 family endonuclease
MLIETASISASEVARLGLEGLHPEIVDGQWFYAYAPEPSLEGDMMAVGKLHSKIGARIIAALLGYLEDQPLGEVYQDGLGYVLKGGPEAIDLMYIPDVSFVLAARVVESEPEAYYYQAPDLAVEIISPGERVGDIQRKLDDYLFYGVQQVWQIYPQQRKVVVHYADGTALTYRPGGILAGGDLLPGFSLPVEKLFS